MSAGTKKPVDVAHALTIAANCKRRADSAAYQATRGMPGEELSQTEKACALLADLVGELLAALKETKGNIHSTTLAETTRIEWVIRGVIEKTERHP